MKNIDLTNLLAEVTATEQTDAGILLILKAHSQAIKDAVAAQIVKDGFANDSTNTALQSVIDLATERFVAARKPIADAIVANTGGADQTPAATPAPPAQPEPPVLTPVEGEPSPDTPAVPPPAENPAAPDTGGSQ